MPLPQRSLLQSIGIESVDRVVLRHDEDNIVHHTADGQVRHIERLGIDLTIDRIGIQLPEQLRIHIRRSQRCFVGVRAVADIVIVIGKDRYFSRWRVHHVHRGIHTVRRQGNAGCGDGVGAGGPRRRVQAAGGDGADYVVAAGYSIDRPRHRSIGCSLHGRGELLNSLQRQF